jgi:dsDNA-specific endonuclease/ATPase MutS2
LASKERTNAAVERLARTTRDSYEAVIGHAVALQERNVRFAQGMIEAFGSEYRQQAEANRAMTQELVERVEEQRDALQVVAEESLDAYMDLFYAPLSYYKEGLEAAREITR